MKKLATSLLEIASATSITVGAGIASLPAGFIVGGMFGLWFAREVTR